MSALLTTGNIWEDSGPRLMARVVNTDGSAMLQSSVSSITYAVFDLSVGQPPDSVATGTLTISSVVFDTYQTDARWTKDTTGYNFGWNAPASSFPKGGRKYQVEIKVTPTSGEIFYLVYKITSKETFTA